MAMTKLSGIAVVAAVGLAAGAGGFLVGKNLLDPPPAPRAEDVAPSKSEPDATGPGALRAPSTLSPEAAEVFEAALAIARAGDAMAALRRLFDIDDEIARKQAVNDLILQLDAASIGALMGVAMRMVEDDDVAYGDEVELIMDNMGDALALFDRWAELDIDAVAEFTMRLGDEEGDESSFFRYFALAIIASRDRGRAAGIAEEIGLKPGLGDDQGAILKMVVALGEASRDPAAGARALLESLDPEEASGLDVLFNTLGPRVGEVLPTILQLPPGEVRYEALGELFARWGRTDPQAALVAAGALGEGDDRDEILNAVMDGYAALDPQAALDYADSLPAGEQRDAVIAVVIDSMMDRDPGLALARADTRLDPDAMGELVARYSSDVSAEVGTAIVSEMGEGARAAFLEATDLGDDDHFLWKLAADDAPLALGWLVENDALDGDSPFGEKFGKAAATQGVAAIEGILRTLPAGSEVRREFIENAALHHAQIQPEEALNWAQDLGDEEGEIATSHVFHGWAMEDAAAATEHAQTAGESEQVIADLGKAWARQDAEGAYRWIVESNDGDPAAIEQAITDTDLHLAWTDRDPVGAAEAMFALPPEMAPAQVGSVIEHWASEEPLRASAFINDQLEAGPTRDAAVHALIRSIYQRDPESAAQWAGTIVDETLRSEVNETFLRN